MELENLPPSSRIIKRISLDISLDIHRDWSCHLWLSNVETGGDGAGQDGAGQDGTGHDGAGQDEGGRVEGSKEEEEGGITFLRSKGVLSDSQRPGCLLHF